MEKSKILGSMNRIAIALAVLVFGSSFAGAEENAPPDAWRFEESLRIRGESYDWFAPGATATTPSPDEREDFWHSKLQLGAFYDKSQFSAGFQLQYFQVGGLAPGTSGPGAVYFATNGDRDPGDVAIRQAFVTWKADEARSLAVTAGRFLYANGGEVKSENPKLQSLKQGRIHNRVFGTFDYTGGRSFDGISALLSPFDDTVGLAIFRPTQGGFATDAMQQIEEIHSTALSYTSKWGAEDAGEIQFFHYYYDDSRDDVVKVDNRPLEIRTADAQTLQIHSVGASIVQLMPFESFNADLLTWGIAQIGDWGDDDHRAGAFALESGVTLSEVGMKPRVAFGYNWGSGDSNPVDGTHNTYFQMLPTARQYALLPFFNAMNNEEFFLQVSATPLPTLTLRSAVRALHLQNDNDLLYGGGGAGRSDQFGFSGTPLADDELGVVMEGSIEWRACSAWLLAVYYGHLEGGDGFDAMRDRSIDFAFLESTITF